MGSRQVVIAGAGIAGLTAAIAFAERGATVRVYERSSRLDEIGAGLQLSPNATSILDRLGVLDLVRTTAVRPQKVVMRNAASLVELAHVPLGDAALRRWKSPYLVIHRADLQNALLERIARQPLVRVTTSANVADIATRNHAVTASVDVNGLPETAEGSLFVAADGVWSSHRGLVGPADKSRFSGELAWRTTILSDSDAGRRFAAVGSLDAVTTFLHPGFHLVAYPIRSGAAVNLVAFTPGTAIAENWSGEIDPDALKRAMRGTAPALARLVDEAAPWTAWPLHTVNATRPWTNPAGIALIGDAAHAMTPFAAQGAAMAIEDAFTLAEAVTSAPDDLAAALAKWEAARRPRVIKVARRGALNRFAWHAAGPVALGRNIFLRMRAPESLAADLDWLYGWAPSD